MTSTPEIPRQERFQVTAADGVTHRFYTHDEVQAAIAQAMMGAVKPLEWFGALSSYFAVSAVGAYQCHKTQNQNTDNFKITRIYIDGQGLKQSHSLGYYNGLDAAQAAAQADYQARILSALSAPTDAMAALEAVKAEVLDSAVEKLTALIIELQNDKKRAKVDFNRGAVDALHEAKAAIRALEGGE